MKKDLYDVLGIDKKAKKEDIKKAYRNKAKKAHPDAGGNSEEFKTVSEAYVILYDDDKRKKYDRGEDVDSTSVKQTMTDRAKQMLLQEFIKAYSDIDTCLHSNVVNNIKMQLGQTADVVRKQMKKAKKDYRRLQKRLKQIKIKKKDKDSFDLAEAAQQQVLQNISTSHKTMVADIRCLNVMIRIMENYKDEFKEIDLQQTDQFMSKTYSRDLNKFFNSVYERTSYGK